MCDMDLDGKQIRWINRIWTLKLLAEITILDKNRRVNKLYCLKQNFEKVTRRVYNPIAYQNIYNKGFINK